MEAKLQACKVPELKALLQKANLPVSGNKADLVQRLMENPAAASSISSEDETAANESSASAPAIAGASNQSASNTKPPQASTAAPATSTPAGASKQTPATEKTSSEASSTAPAVPQKSAEDRKVELVAELEKRKARAARWGLQTGEAEAKLERAIKFGIDPSADVALKNLELGLKAGGERRGEKGRNGKKEGKPQEQKSPPKEPETEEQKAARLARQEADEAARKRRAERFGTSAPAKEADPADEEKKRKRLEKFGSAGSPPAEKKTKV